jgi:hypothetical protein
MYVLTSSASPFRDRYKEEGASLKGKIGLRKLIKPREKCPDFKKNYVSGAS